LFIAYFFHILYVIRKGLPTATLFYLKHRSFWWNVHFNPTTGSVRTRMVSANGCPPKMDEKLFPVAEQKDVTNWALATSSRPTSILRIQKVCTTLFLKRIFFVAMRPLRRSSAMAYVCDQAVCSVIFFLFPECVWCWNTNGLCRAQEESSARSRP